MEERPLPMLANQLDIDRVGKYSHYIMEPKVDGLRMIVKRGMHGLSAWTRTGKELTDKLPEEMIKELYLLPEGTIVDGELGYLLLEDKDRWPIFDFNRTMRVFGSGEGTAQDKIAYNRNAEQEFMRLPYYYVFDILQYRNEDMIGHALYQRKSFQQMCVSLDLSGAKYVRQTDVYHTYDEATYEHFVKEGGEGVMLKNPSALYYPGARKANTWYKLKKFNTIDVVVIGWKEGQGKYQGTTGAIEFGMYMSAQSMTPVSFGWCAGMDDATRNDICDLYESGALYGKVFELRYFGKVGRDGKGYRFPQFMRWRPDKSPQECVYRQ
jgi:bifunctional non-homologous end joining protein LigD